MSEYGRVCLSVMLAAALLFLIGCAGSPQNKFVGDWERVEASGYGESQDWARVSMSGDSLFWEDSNGKFPASMEDGHMMIDVDGFAAMATFDEATGVLTFIVHGNSIEYKRKE
jgi:hypothetical protein